MGMERLQREEQLSTTREVSTSTVPSASVICIGVDVCSSYTIPIIGCTASSAHPSGRAFRQAAFGPASQEKKGE
jgi:hypothetical protein